MKLNRILSSVALSALLVTPAAAQRQFDITTKPGAPVQSTMYGIFFEDINQSVDGGISAQLIQNNSFQAYNVPFNSDTDEFSKCDTVFFGWTVINKEGAGKARTVNDRPLVKDLKPLYDFDPDDEYDDSKKYQQYSVRFDIEDPGQGFGIAANGCGISE